MKILSCHLENFASYKSLDFNFQDQGLTLIHGATGSGKSTLCDAIPWILFGKTAKDGAADEVLSWNGGVTSGNVYVLTNKGGISIHRIRGDKSNDLWYTLQGPEAKEHRRGVNLIDTQRIINQLLGFDSSLYLSGAYYHEFSQTAQFFTTTAKNRRAITEQLVDLSLAKKLTEQASAKAKAIRQDLMKAQNDYNSAEAFMLNTETMLKEHHWLEQTWRQEIDLKIDELANQSLAWEKGTLVQKQEIELQINRLEVMPDSHFYVQIKQYKELISKINKDEECPECGQCTKNDTELYGLLAGMHKVEKQQAKNASNKVLKLQLEHQLKSIGINPHLSALELLDTSKNPHTKAVDSLSHDYHTYQRELTQHTWQLEELKQQETDLDILQDTINQFRSILIENTILSIQDQTNNLLTSHFDGELRIELAVSDADKVEVLITKDGNTASFSQLSKGQRQILKLCFGVSIMKAVQQHHSVNFEQIFIDEALEGLDETRKIKALRLLECLSTSYNSLFFIDHSEAIKTMITNKIEVELINGSSEISKNS